MILATGLMNDNQRGVQESAERVEIPVEKQGKKKAAAAASRCTDGVC